MSQSQCGWELAPLYTLSSFLYSLQWDLEAISQAGRLLLSFDGSPESWMSHFTAGCGRSLWGLPGRQRVQGQHALALFAHFPRSLTVIWQKATLTQRSWEGQEMGVRSKRRNRKSSEVEAERINTWRLRAVCRLTSVGPARPQPREKCCHLTALATIKGRVPWRMGLDTWASNPSLQ